MAGLSAGCLLAKPAFHGSTNETLSPGPCQAKCESCSNIRLKPPLPKKLHHFTFLTTHRLDDFERNIKHRDSSPTFIDHPRLRSLAPQCLPRQHLPTRISPPTKARNRLPSDSVGNGTSFLILIPHITILIILQFKHALPQGRPPQQYPHVLLSDMPF